MFYTPLNIATEWKYPDWLYVDKRWEKVCQSFWIALADDCHIGYGWRSTIQTMRYMNDVHSSVTVNIKTVSLRARATRSNELEDNYKIISPVLVSKQFHITCLLLFFNFVLYVGWNCSVVIWLWKEWSYPLRRVKIRVIFMPFPFWAIFFLWVLQLSVAQMFQGLIQ